MVRSGMNNPYYIGVEIGGTKQQLAVGLSDGTILDSRQVKLVYRRGAEDILEWLSENIREYLEMAPYAGCVAGIGVGFGGPIETATGRVLASLQVPGWKDFELKRWFETEFKLPVIVANDTVTGGFGELYKGAGRDSENLLYTNIGTGIGGGLYIHRKYYDGSGFGASYLGNMLVPDWRSLIPGSYTRTELLCSGLSIEKRLRGERYIPNISSLSKYYDGDMSRITCADLAEAARAGDMFACVELDKIAESFSIALVNILAAQGVDTIVIGGGVSKMGEILFDRIRETTDRLAFIANKDRYRILQSELLDDAVLVGALLIASGKYEKI